MYLKTKYQNVI